MSKRPNIAPRQFKTLALPDFFKAPLGSCGEQHDCSEFARIFLDKLESEIKQSSVENINLKYLEGKKVNLITCETCGSVSENTETFIDLGINFPSEDK